MTVRQNTKKKRRKSAQKRKLSALTRFLVICILIVITYSIVELVISYKAGISHDTLTTCVYAFFGTELASCTVIKVFNILKIEDHNIKEDD